MRNEEERIVAALRAFAKQKHLAPGQFELLLLLNNCTDRSYALARLFADGHPQLRVHIVQLDLAPEAANIGTARRILMDEACRRLLSAGRTRGAILATDADTRADPQWIAANLGELINGADVASFGPRSSICIRRLR